MSVMPSERQSDTAEHSATDRRNEQNTTDHHADVPELNPKDHWTQAAYKTSASFVPLLTEEILQWLDPYPGDSILDIGCGDGALTTRVAANCANVTGLDGSPNFIQTAKSYNSLLNTSWHVLDCRYLEGNSIIKGKAYDKVFSNAALHWILRDASTRVSVLRGAYEALRSGGDFVFEMGGIGNVAEMHAALLAALVHQGVSIEAAREACPWLFPSEQLMQTMLEEVGFSVRRSKLEYRPTRLTDEKQGGLEGWVRLMGAQFLEILDSEAKKEAAIKEVCHTLQTVITRTEDSSTWLGYVRLKVIAQK